jgi:hypothetical protein
MDESLQELENELKRLTPRRPSAAFHAAVEREFGAPADAPRARRYATATTLRSWKWVSWTFAGAAAAATVALLFTPRSNPVPGESAAVNPGESAAVETPVPTEVAANRYEPVKATSVLYDLQESAPAKLPDMTEGREVRYRYVDTYTWKNPATNASLSWSVPRDEVRFVRANLD